MDEREIEELERRLRRATSGRRPAAPDELLHFIESVPGRHHAGRRVERFLAGSRARRGVFAIAAAAALVVAIVASATLMAVRNGQSGPGGEPGAPSLTAWSWQRADGTDVNWAYQVANGYLGGCGAVRDESFCSSPDGLHWTTPSDPKILVVEGDRHFSPNSFVRSGGVFLAAGDSYSGASMATPTPAGSDGSFTPGASIWRSPDGLHWSQVESTAFSGLSPMSVVDVQGGFVVIAVGAADGSGWALTSTDGLSWILASRLPIQPNCTAAGPAGLYIGSTGADPQVWRSLDGRVWTLTQLPAGTCAVGSYAIPGGGFVGLGIPAGAPGLQVLVSDDGLIWRVDPGDLQGVPIGLVSVGSRLFANVSSARLDSSAYPDASAFALNAFAIWQSSDWGRTWQPLLDNSGRQMSGQVRPMGDKLAISTPDTSAMTWRITWVGSSVGAATALPDHTAAGP